MGENGFRGQNTENRDALAALALNRRGSVGGSISLTSFEADAQKRETGRRWVV
jgi:hypothetical protein